MKSLFLWLVILAVGLTSCSNFRAITPTLPTAVRIEVTRIVQVTTTPLPQKTLLPPTAVKVEVTRIIQITTTPIPTKISTPTAALNPEDWQSTQIAEIAGTPIVESFECYQTAFTQADMNSCSISRKDEMERQMEKLLNLVKRFYSSYSEEDLQSFSQFQTEWVDFVQRECTFRSGNYSLSGDSGVLKGGSMARMNYNECLVQKYQVRLRELHLLLIPEG